MFAFRCAFRNLLVMPLCLYICMYVCLYVGMYPFFVCSSRLCSYVFMCCLCIGVLISVFMYLCLSSCIYADTLFISLGVYVFIYVECLFYVRICSGIHLFI